MIAAIRAMIPQIRTRMNRETTVLSLPAGIISPQVCLNQMINEKKIAVMMKLSPAQLFIHFLISCPPSHGVALPVFPGAGPESCHCR
jgi:hypothetical protein